MSIAQCIRVRVIHDDPVAQEGLSAAFAKYSDFEIDSQPCGSGDSSALFPLPSRSSADVIVADYANGVAIARAAAQEAYAPRRPKVMILATADREWEIRSAIERGVRGYMLAGCALDDLAGGVRAVHRGERHLAPQIAARLAESLSVEALTAREEEVLRLVVAGLCNKAIGKLLGIAVGTVKSHLKSTFDKLHVQSRTQAVAVVERRGLLRDRPHIIHEGRTIVAPLLVRVSAGANGGYRAGVAA